MKRRDFIKACSIFAFSELFLNGCKKENAASDSEKWVQHIEIPICYHCNLDCAGCDHFSPLAPKYEMPVNVFLKDIKQFSKITKGKVKDIYLLGGEPTLHKKIEELIKITRRYFPNSYIAILSNGLSYNNMSDNFWKTCGKYKINVLYTKYIKCENYPKNFDIAEANAKKYNVTTGCWPCTHFQHMQLSTKPIYDYQKVYQNCTDKIVCSILDNGILTPCAVRGSIKFYNNYFKNEQIPVFKEDSLDIYKVSSIDEILEFYEKPKKMCAYCGYHVKLQPFPWHHTKRIASEWCSNL